ncbi:transporter [bacterium]|nr:transporter [bacterium]
MKRSLIVLTLIAFLLVISIPADAQILWRGAKTMKKGSMICMAEWYYMNFTKKWDTASEEWKDLPSGTSSSKWGFETMFGYAITDQWEAHLHIPILFINSDDGATETSESGISDMYLKTRYAVIPWAKDKHGLTLTGALRFPTGDKDKGLGDGSTDFALGAILSTKWFGKSRGHLKANYWINGENEDKDKAGNELKIIIKYDYNFNPKFMGFASVTPYFQSEKEENGTAKVDSDKTRYTLTLGGCYKPKPGMFVRPKLGLPLGGKTGMNFSFKPMLDFWYVFSL